MENMSAASEPLGSEFSTGQLLEALEWKIHAIKEDPVAKAAQQDKATKDEVALLRNDIANLQAVVSQLSSKVDNICEFNQTLAPIPVSTETLLQATRKAYEKYPFSFRKGKKLDPSNVAKFLLCLTGLSLEGDSIDWRLRLEKALEVPGFNETSDVERAQPGPDDFALQWQPESKADKKHIFNS
ncbi:hypothetical protein NLG97_g8442 [Lecanicillium saksenae]|uniref:Uncharacterized protein n=1 Tax=Lecanicillium saksenae TaxID=468837 RepID=A0ACC1QK99_9HYPO|nr:hypothetical protein NLG97_g8442 [Lecanicillium saksenae]